MPTLVNTVKNVKNSQKRSKTVIKGQKRSTTVQNGQKRSKMVKIFNKGQQRSIMVKNAQKCFKNKTVNLVKHGPNNQNWSEMVRNSLKQPNTVKCNPERLGAGKCSQEQPEAAKCS